MSLGDNMPKKFPKFCCEDTDRHGNVRVYFRKSGQPKIRLHGMIWTPAFMVQYEQALKGSSKSDAALDHRGKPNTWRWLCQQYFASADYARLSSRTRTVRRQILEATFDEPVNPASSVTFADFPIQRMTRKAIKTLRDRKVATPEAANGRLKAIRQVFAYALEDHDALVTTNPARDIPFFKSKGSGFHAWTVGEVVQYLETHKTGSKARKALALLLYTGVRRSDVVRLGKQMVRDGWLKFQPVKTRHISGALVEIPLLPQLAAELAQGTQEHLTYLVTEFGKPFTPEGFGNKFKDWCRDAALPHCTAHGLRKAGATIAAENGATEHQLMAIFGWTSAKMAEHYTRTARKRKLAGAGMNFLSINSERSEGETVPLLGSGGTVCEESSTISKRTN